MTTSREDQNFLNEVIGTSLLENSIEWIKDNMTPDQIFEERVLSDWAIDNGFIKSEE